MAASRLWVGALIGLLGSAIACSGGQDEGSSAAPPSSTPPTRAESPAPPERLAEAKPPAPPAEPVSHEALVAEGRGTYMSNCTACHNVNPAQDGALGPAVTGASRELLEARVVQGGYPEGYTPKRDTQLMIALPHLAPKIDALTAYLDSVGS